MDWEICWVTKVGHDGESQNAYAWIEFDNRNTQDNSFKGYADGLWKNFKEISLGDTVVVLRDEHTVKSVRHAGKQIWYQPTRPED